MAARFSPPKFWTSRDKNWRASEKESIVNIEDFKHVPQSWEHKGHHSDEIGDCKGHCKQVSIQRKKSQASAEWWMIPMIDQWFDQRLERGVCGYREEDTFSLIMNRYNGSLRGAIEYQLMKRKRAMLRRLGVFILITSLLIFDTLMPVAVIPLWLFLPLHISLMIVWWFCAVSLAVAHAYWVVGKPFPDENILVLMIQIALRMHALHAKGKVHRGLQAENVFVTCNKATRLPVAVSVRESELVAGASFWQAPEVLERMQEGRSFRFEPEADVYSYGMTCYEILFGWIPPGFFDWPQYKVDTLFVQHWRPRFPFPLNPKVKDLIERCWHQNPAMRPTFADIVAEWEGLVDELVTGSQDMSKVFKGMFVHAKTSLDVEIAGIDSSLITLKKLLEELVAKYDGADCVVAGLEVVAATEEFLARFASPLSFAERHDDPDWFSSRRKARDAILHKRAAFAPSTAAHVAEVGTISALMDSTVRAISKEHFSDEAEVESFKKPDETRDGDAAKVEYNLFVECEDY